MPPTTPSQGAIREPFQPVAALLAVVLPGLGHFYLGQTRRAILITAGVLGLFGTGVLIGGISCIDRRDNFVWFLGQALMGPLAIGLDHYHQTQLKVIGPRAYSNSRQMVLRSAYPNETRNPRDGTSVAIQVDEKSGKPYAVLADGTRISPAYPPYVRSLTRTNELGTLFTTIAGFMNVIVIIDAAFNSPVARRRKTVSTDVKRTLKAPTLPTDSGRAA